MNKQDAINNQLRPFLTLSGTPKWEDIYNAINQFILITNELEKQGYIEFKEPVEQSKEAVNKE